MDIIRTLQQKPEKTRKAVVWLIVVVIGVGLIFFYIINTRKRLRDFNAEGFKKQLNFPVLNEEFKKVPSINLPEVTEENLKKFENAGEGTATPPENNSAVND